MARAFAVQTRIERPVDEVWAALTDWPNAHRWMPGVDSIEADGPVEVGTGLTFRARGRDRPSRIAAVEDGKRLTLQSTQGGVTADYRYQLTPHGAQATDVSLVADCATSGLWSLAGPLLRMVMRRADDGQLDHLKRHIEARDGLT